MPTAVVLNKDILDRTSVKIDCEDYKAEDSSTDAWVITKLRIVWEYEDLWYLKHSLQHTTALFVPFSLNVAKFLLSENDTMK